MIVLDGVHKRYPLQAGFFARDEASVYAVNGLSLTVQPGEIYGLVGESGCGKTTTARLLVRMEGLTEGDITYTDRSGRTFHLRNIHRNELKELRSRIRYVFQDPARSLNPRLSVREVLLSGYRYAPRWPGKVRAEEEAAEILREVGLSPDDLERRPADFSGGQRQRISIARALITRPEVLVCDEVVSALDVSIQGQILRLLLRIREERNLTMIFIAHDLAVVGYVSDRIGVMYRGVLVEEAPATTLLRDHRHPYTRYLFDAIPALSLPDSDGPAAQPTAASTPVSTARQSPAQSLGPTEPPTTADGAEAVLFTGQADPTVNPVRSVDDLVMDEPVPGHRVSRIFTESRDGA